MATNKKENTIWSQIAKSLSKTLTEEKASEKPRGSHHHVHKKKSPNFTKECAYQLFENLKGSNYEINRNMLDQCFEFSMMTVLDEHRNLKKYQYLNFVEFLDMVCRIAIVGITVSDTVD